MSLPQSLVASSMMAIVLALNREVQRVRRMHQQLRRGDDANFKLMVIKAQQRLCCRRAKHTYSQHSAEQVMPPFNFTEMLLSFSALFDYPIIHVIYICYISRLFWLPGLQLLISLQYKSKPYSEEGETGGRWCIRPLFCTSKQHTILTNTTEATVVSIST